MYNHIAKQINALLDSTGKDTVIVAIDGSCAAGKSTLCTFLQENFDCNVFHMDDFFLTPDMKTDDRLSQAGGNVDYERFREDVLSPLLTAAPFSYRPFDCKTFTLSEPISVTPKKLTIIEGSYSMHPYFGDVQDVRIFLESSKEGQSQRILVRNGPEKWKQFEDVWIPMEEKYFEEFGIRKKCRCVNVDV